MDYLKSEHLKFKRTISNKLIFIVPLITAIFAWIMGGYMGYQYMTLYWWYAFLLPGAIAILCSLSHRKEENAGKYYSVFSMPVNLSRFEFAKGIILVEKLLVSAIFLALLISISNIIAPATAVYSLLHSITGSIGIILASVWQIPLCLYLAQGAGAKSIEVTDDNIKAFERVARKYNVDFAVKRDKTTEPPKYLVFFKGKDADVIAQAFKEFVKVNEKKQQRPSLRQKLKGLQKMIAQNKNRERSREKNKDRGQSL